jgi:multimeric flavodoxin WrbA
MKIVGVVGSKRENGNTEAAIKIALQTAESMGAEVDIILLSKMHINPCDGCGDCKVNECHFKDDMQLVLAKLTKADAIILSSPVYYGSVAGGFKCFLDRCRPLKQQGNKLMGKIGGAIAVGKVWGHLSVLDSIIHFFGSQGIVPTFIKSNPGLGVQILASEIGDIENDTVGCKSLQELGKCIVDFYNQCDATKF